MKKKRYSTPVIASITIARPLPPDPLGANDGRCGNRGNSGNVRRMSIIIMAWQSK